MQIRSYTTQSTMGAIVTLLDSIQLVRLVYMHVTFHLGGLYEGRVFNLLLHKIFYFTLAAHQ